MYYREQSLSLQYRINAYISEEARLPCDSSTAETSIHHKQYFLSESNTSLKVLPLYLPKDRVGEDEVGEDEVGEDEVGEDEIAGATC